MSPRFPFVPQRFESFPSDLPEARWRNLVCLCVYVVFVDD